MAKLLDKINVVDVESTCWDGEPPAGQVSEIIEIGICVIDVATLQRIEKQSILIKPVKSQISAFCTQLTSLELGMFASAGSLADAVSVLKKTFSARERLWASWGDYDRRQFERVCQDQRVTYPFGLTHLNAKTLFATALGLPREIGLDGAYDKLEWKMEGRHHRGDDDAWNIARLVCELLGRVRATSAHQT